MKKLILLTLSSFLIFSCSTRKEIVYFQDSENLDGMVNLMDYEPVIENNDVLQINVSSMNQAVVAPFQQNVGNQRSGGGSGSFGGGGSSGVSGSSGSSRGGNSSLIGYLVDSEGNIQFPVLGKVQVAKKTRTEIQEMLQARIRKYVTDAVVDVRIINFRITVLGEVNSPGRVEVTDGRITIPELLAMSGDISYGGKRENITVIREVDGVKSVGKVDMTDISVFNNPYYYLKQNDIVYVEPTYREVKSAGLVNSYGGLISLGTTIISLVLLLTR